MSANEDTVAIIIPCYNEAARLDPQRFVKWSGDNPRTVLIFANDGSTDSTGQMLDELAEKDRNRFFAFHLNSNSGKAEAVRQGVLHAFDVCGAAYFGYWDADLATPLDEIPRFIEQLDRQPDINIVLGSRVKLLGRQIERKMLRHYLGRVFATAASMTLGLKVYDTQCGAKMFRRNTATERAFAQQFTTRWVFDVQLLQRYLRNAKADTIVELPLMRWRDVEGSKVKPRDFFVAFFDLVRIATDKKR